MDNPPSVEDVARKFVESSPFMKHAGNAYDSPALEAAFVWAYNNPNQRSEASKKVEAALGGTDKSNAANFLREKFVVFAHQERGTGGVLLE